MPESILEAVGNVGRTARWAVRLVSFLGSRPRYPAEWSEHFLATTWRGLLPTCTIVASFGAVVALQGLNIFRIFGTEAMLPSLVVIAILREAAPTFTAVTLAAQAGSTLAAELAVMRVKEELDATEVMSVDPIRYHVLPRVIGLLGACPLLTVLSGACGIATAWVITVFLAGVSPGAFRQNMFGFLTRADFAADLVKSLSYAGLIGVIATWQGYHAGRGARGVGMAANRAVVTSIVSIVAVNYILTSVLFGAISS